jgi:hypothetical protein
MGTIGKSLSILLIFIIVASCLILAKSAFAQSIPKPSAPEFISFKIVSYPYDVAPTTTIDPYTGKTVTTQPGYHVENKSIEFAVQNQPFTYSSNSTTYRLYYNVRSKGHFGQDWLEFYGQANNTSGYSQSLPVFPMQSNVSITTFSYPENYPSDALIDFQVIAIVGHIEPVFVIDHLVVHVGHYELGIGIDETSDWSEIYTLNMTDGTFTIMPNTSISSNYTPSPNLTSQPTFVIPTINPSSPIPTPVVPEFPSWIILTLFIAFTLSTLLVYFKKHKR